MVMTGRPEAEVMVTEGMDSGYCEMVRRCCLLEFVRGMGPVTYTNHRKKWYYSG